MVEPHHTQGVGLASGGAWFASASRITFLNALACGRAGATTRTSGRCRGVEPDSSPSIRTGGCGCNGGNEFLRSAYSRVPNLTTVFSTVTGGALGGPGFLNALA